MSFQRRLVANYVSQIYVALIGILMLPMYVRYMGIEAYGLVGFFAMLQAWFQLLDMGLTPTLSREAARYLGGATSALQLRQLLKILEYIFGATALAGGAGLVLSAGYIATGWLKIDSLPLVEVHHAISLMGVCIALRWMGSVYRSLLNGLEQQVWLGHFNMASATARFVLVIPFFLIVGADPVQFFSYQLVVALAETVLVGFKAYRLLPLLPVGIPRVTAEWSALRGVLHFSLGVALTSSLWVCVTQTDKLLLSKLLSLSDYASYTLAVLLASGVSIISGPISGVLMPRLARLHASKDSEGLLRLYRVATQGVTLIACTMAVAMACFAKQFLWAWTGDLSLAEQVAPTLKYYALGNGVLALGAFPYYLQYANGNVRLHLWGSLFFVSVLIPSVFIAANTWGATGAGKAWLTANLLYLILWVPLVHRRFLPGIHLRWLLIDIALVVVVVGLVGIFLVLFLPTVTERWDAAWQAVGAGFCMLLSGVAASPTGRLIARRIFASSDHISTPRTQVGSHD